MKNVLITTYIGDEHFGAVDPEILYNEEKEIYFKTLKKLPYIDIIFINGDKFDYNLSLNSKSCYYAFKSMKKIVKIAKQKNAKIRIIKGTRSHDHNQNDIFVPLYENEIDIKVINNVSSEYVDDINILYLPEEYINNYKEYYHDYFNGNIKYDIIVGHGMIEECAFQKASDETVSKQSVIFKSKDLLDCSYGPIVFGHIHEAYTFKERIFYTGSFTRWMQGQENPKGFLISLYDKNTKNFKMIPVINYLARKYVTLNDLTYEFISSNHIDDILDYIDNFKKKNNIYKLRIILKEQKDMDYMSKLTLIFNYYSDKTDVDVDFKKTIIETIDDNEEEKNIIDKYSYLMDDKVSDESKISQFIQQKKGYNISPEMVSKFLNNNILTILDELGGNIDEDSR